MHGSQNLENSYLCKNSFLKAKYFWTNKLIYERLIYFLLLLALEILTY